MDAVKSFNAELSSLYDVKPPISKAKMTAITRGAIKAIKFYKHVVQSVEKFIQKCKPEYKVPGLYVIDSIVRQSRHQFGAEKDVFAPRFSKNLTQTFVNLFTCPPEEKSKVVRVLNLWQKNTVFQSEVIQPLFDLADPSNPLHQELAPVITSNGSITTLNKTPPTSTNKGSSKQDTPVWLALAQSQIDAASNAVMQMSGQAGGPLPPAKPVAPPHGASAQSVDANIIHQLQQLQQLLIKQQQQESGAHHDSAQIKFDKKLLDFDYGSEDDDDPTSPKQAPPPTHHQASQQATTRTGTPRMDTQRMGTPRIDTPRMDTPRMDTPKTESPGVSLHGSGVHVPTLLSNPEVLRQLQTLQQQMSQQQHELEEKVRKLQEMKQQEDEFDKHLAQTVPNLPFASECDLKPTESKPSTVEQQLPPLAQMSHFEHQDFQQNKPAYMFPGMDMSQPPPGYSHPPPLPPPTQEESSLEDGEHADSELEYIDRPGHQDTSSVEIINLDRSHSRSQSPGSTKGYRKRRSLSRDRRRNRRTRSRSPIDDNSRSRSKRRRSRSRDRDRERDREREREREKEKEREKERDRERKKRGLPPVKKDHLSVCSTTLWVGHLSKLVHQEELSDTFGEYGDIVSIDLIPPRGCAFICMNRRQDAFRALQKLKNHKLQGKAITVIYAESKPAHVMWSLYCNIMQATPTGKTNLGLTPEDEVEGYLRKSVVSPDTNVLQFWKVHSARYPRLCQLTKKYRTIPPATVFAERLFSTEGLICDKK